MLSSPGHLRTRLRAEERGASVVEYGLLVVLIAVVCVSALVFFGAGNSDSLDQTGSCVDDARARRSVSADCR